MDLFESGSGEAVSAEEVGEQRAVIALSMVPGVGPGRIRALVAHFGTAAEALQASPRALARVPGIGRQTARAIRMFDDHAAVEGQLRRAASSGAELLGAWDPRFPVLLRTIYDPPAFLWMRGALEPSDRRSVAIVGTRRATGYGRRVAALFAAELAQGGFTVISGLAYGIDTVAHEAALEAGGRTLAVLGSGVDRIYPARNSVLAKRIVAQGALLSEYPLGAAPDAPNFPRRNRLISGLAQGTLVAEAFETGGALITARLALEQNREVFAVPGSLFAPSSQGCHLLVQQGCAKLVTSVGDVLEELGGYAAPGSAPGPPNAEPPPVSLSGVEQTLWDVLTTTPVPIDTLCARAGLDPSTALVYLLSLEFKGLVRQMAGKQFYRTR